MIYFCRFNFDIKAGNYEKSNVFILLSKLGRGVGESKIGRKCLGSDSLGWQQMAQFIEQ